jgi:hypothetical protein
VESIIIGLLRYQGDFARRGSEDATSSSNLNTEADAEDEDPTNGNGDFADDMLDFNDEYGSSDLSDDGGDDPNASGLLPAGPLLPIKNIDSALESKQSFDRMFIILANKATQSFRSAEKDRSVSKVTSSIGQLHLCVPSLIITPPSLFLK